MQKIENGDFSFLLTKGSMNIPGKEEVFSTVLTEIEKKKEEKKRIDFVLDDNNSPEDLNQKLLKKSIEPTKDKEEIKKDNIIEERKKEDNKPLLSSNTENRFIINIPFDFQNLKEILLFIKDKINEVIRKDQVFSQDPVFLIKFDKNVFPLGLKITKIDSKFDITIYSTGSLKDDLSNNLSSLINQLKIKGIELASINIEEFVNQEKDRDSQKRKRDPFSDEEVDYSQINKIIKEI
ncbi:MAG: hypothetical protein WC860_03590 [Candidatus Margulisiibacteriota bacterium]|jgi:hypothetical protein